MTTKIPATVITGFLGAGKTTMVRHLIENAGGKRLAIIVNEFGAVGIDGDILRGCGDNACAEENIVELANGCLCCTVADEFLPTMVALIERAEPPDHIIIETSGLALPKPLIKAFDWPDVRSRLTVDGVIAVVDAPAVATGRYVDDPEALAAQRVADPALDHDNPLAEVFEDQVLAADLVVINKTDLVNQATLEQVRAEIAKAQTRRVKLIETVEGKVDPLILLGLEAAAEDDLAARPSHHDAEGAEHEHDDFTSFVVEIPAVTSPEALADRLGLIAADHGVLRMKGFVAVAGKPMRLLVQGVGHRFRHHYDRPWTAAEERTGRIVVIGEKSLDQVAIATAITAVA